MSQARNITLTAAASALGFLAVAVGAIAPLTLVPISIATIAYMLVYKRCGKAYGVMASVTASVLAVIFFGLTTGVLLHFVVAVPYAFLASLIDKYRYTTKNGIIRRLVMLAVLTVFVTVMSVLFFEILVGTYGALERIRGFLFLICLPIGVALVIVDYINVYMFDYLDQKIR